MDVLELASPHLHWASAVLTPPILWLPILFRTLSLAVAAPIIFLSALDVVAYLIARTLGTPAHPHYYGTLDHPTSLPPKVKAGLPADSDLRIITAPTRPTIIISPASAGLEPHTLSSALSSLQQAQSSSTNSSSSTLSLDSPQAHRLHFTSPSEGNFALAGEGVFSPPESRSSSPPLYKTRRRAASIGVEALGVISDEETSEEGGSSTDGSSVAGDTPGKETLGTVDVPRQGVRRRGVPGLQMTIMSKA